MDLVTPLMQALQANANLEHTESVTQDTRALAQQRILNTQLLGINLQRTQNGMAALQQFFSGQPTTDPSFEPQADDNPIQAQQRNLARMQRDANMQRGAAMAVAKAGGDPALVDKMMDNATQASHWAAYAAREVNQERKSQADLLASIASAVKPGDDLSAQQGYDRLVRTDPTFRNLAFDRNQYGQVVSGPNTQSTFQTLGTGGINAAKQAELAIKVGDAGRKQFDADTRRANEQRQERLTDSQIARNQASAKVSEATAKQREAGGSGTLSPDDLNRMAEQYLTGDKSVTASLGYGNTGAMNRANLQGAITKLAQSRGMKGEDISAKIAEFSGLVAGERTAGTRAANIEMAVSEASQMGELVKKASEKVSRTDFMPINKALVAWEKNTGDPDVRKFGASINSYINAYARAVSPAGVPTVTDKEHAREMLSTADSHDQVLGIMDQLEAEMEAARQAPPTVRKQLREAVTGKESAPSRPSTPTAAAPVALPPKDQLKAGTVYQTSRGPARWNGTAFEAQ